MANNNVDRPALIREFRQAVNRVQNHPRELAKIFDNVPTPEVTAASSTRRPPTTTRINDNVEPFFASDGTDWSIVLSSWLDVIAAAKSGDAIQCFEHQSTLHTGFNQVFAASTGNCLVPAIHAVCKTTKRMAAAADAALDHNTRRDYEKTNAAVSLLQDSFSKAFNDRKELTIGVPFSEEGSKKAGALGIVNELFSIYFVLNTLRLCNNLIKPVEAKKLHLQGGSMADLVTYRYYAGRLCLFEDNFEMAETHLGYAFDHCHKESVRNKRCILRYLIPVRMFRGRLPSSELLIKYELYEFAALSDSLRQGDMREFNDAMSTYEHRYICQGTYLLLERCRSICYRSLLKRIAFVAESHILSLDTIIYALSWLGMEDVDTDEAECIVANLIYKRMVRGYIHHSQRKVVLSKQNAFPKEALSRQPK